ncbi:MAG: hypothetical protein PHN38_07865 [Sulfurospirillaceae bacterium]|nr:hypothetical protein [Sulfurospirillaceae bacterium]
MLKTFTRWLFLVFVCTLFLQTSVLGEEKKTVVVSAEGLADANADIYKKDKGIMVDDLRNDAKKQIIEKAVGVYVDSQTLVQNYVTLEDKVFSRSSGLIKQVIKESSPWVGDDGFAHMLMKAEVYISDLKAALNDMSKSQRISLIKSQGNPRISVLIQARDAERGGNANKERSDIAENKLKERIKKFGYTVWSETSSEDPTKKPDFTITGEAKFKSLKHKLAASGLVIEKVVLTSWSVKCVNRHTSEEIYFNNKIPKKKSWNTEDEAIEEIGDIIGTEFSADFFTDHLNQPIKTFQLEIAGLPDFDTAEMFKKEFMGLRSILNVDFRNFNANGISVYEIDFGGVSGNFSSMLNEGVIKPLNAKLGADTFKLMSAEGNAVKISFKSKMDKAMIQKTLESLPPTSVAQATPERLNSIVKTKKTEDKVKEIATFESGGSVMNSREIKSSIKNF